MCYVFFLLYLSTVGDLQEDRVNFHLPPPHAGNPQGQQLWAFTLASIWPSAPHCTSPPHGPWEQLSAPQKYCSSSFPLYWLPVSLHHFHLPHTCSSATSFNPTSVPLGLCSGPKHQVCDSTSEGYSTEIQQVHRQLQKHVITAKLIKGMTF